MNDIADPKGTHASCAHVEIPLHRMHNGSVILATTIWNTTSFSSKPEFQEPDVRTSASGGMSMLHTECEHLLTGCDARPTDL